MRVAGASLLQEDPTFCFTSNQLFDMVVFRTVSNFVSGYLASVQLYGLSFEVFIYFFFKQYNTSTDPYLM